MKKLKTQISIFLIISIFLLPFHQSQAIIVHDPGNAFLKKFNIIIDKIFHALTLSTGAIQIASTGAPGTGAVTRAGLKAGKTPCKVYDRAIKIADTADNFAAVTVIAGSAGQLAKLNTKIQALTVLRQCYQAMLDAIETGGTVVGVSGSQALSAIENEDQILTQNINTLDQRLDRLRELRSQAAQEMWRAFAVRLLMTTQQKITTNLVNNAIKKYKISKPLDYAEALATSVYMVDYVNKNVPVGDDQTVYRLFMKNKNIGGKILPQINKKSKAALGFEPGNLDIYDEDYFLKLASVGAQRVNPTLLQLEKEWELDVAKARSLDMARGEINSNAGMLSTREDCKDVIKDQGDFDAENIRLSAEVRNREQALLELQAIKAMTPTLVKDDQIKKAKEDFQKAEDALQALANRAPGNAFKQVCGPIENPGKSISDFTNAYLSSHLNASANVKSENLPFFARFFEATAMNFVDGIFKKGKSRNSLLKEKGVEPLNITPREIVGTGSETRILKDTEQENIASSVFFSGEKNNVGANGYLLKWNAETLPDANYGIITGPQNFSQRVAVVGTLQINPPLTGANYVLRIFNVENQLLQALVYNPGSAANPGAVQPVDDGNVTDALDLIDQVGDIVDPGPPIPEIPPEIIEEADGNSNTVLGAVIYKTIQNIRGLNELKIRGP